MAKAWFFGTDYNKQSFEETYKEFFSIIENIYWNCNYTENINKFNQILDSTHAKKIVNTYLKEIAAASLLNSSKIGEKEYSDFLLKIFNLADNNHPFFNSNINNGYTTLSYSIYKDIDSKLIELFLEKGADPNKTDDNKKTPLIHSVEYITPEIARLLLEKGADPNKADEDGETPLIYAVKWKKPEIVSLLLEKGADPNKAGKNGETPLIHAVDEREPEMVSLLLEKDADPNKAGKNGETPLIHAVDERGPKMVSLLLEKGADVNKADEKGNTPLIHAVDKEGAKMVSLLLEKGADVNKADEIENTPLIYLTKLRWGCKDELVDNLMWGMPDVNLKDKNGNTALYYAISDNKSEYLYYAISNNKSEYLFDAILSLKANVNDVFEKSKSSLLMIASRMDAKYFINGLIKAGANVNATDANGNNALFYFPKDIDPETLGLFKEKGVNFEHANDKGDNLLIKACQNKLPHLFHFLMDEIKVDIFHKNKGGDSPLMAAYASSKFEFVTSLLLKGADPREVDPTTQTMKTLSQLVNLTSLIYNIFEGKKVFKFKEEISDDLTETVIKIIDYKILSSQIDITNFNYKILNDNLPPKIVYDFKKLVETNFTSLIKNQLSSNELDLINNFSSASLDNKQLDQAKKILSKIAKLYEFKEDLVNSLRIYKSIGNFVKSEQILKNIITKDDENPEWYLELAELYKSNNLIEKAKKYYACALSYMDEEAKPKICNELKKISNPNNYEDIITSNFELQQNKSNTYSNISEVIKGLIPNDFDPNNNPLTAEKAQGFTFEDE